MSRILGKVALYMLLAFIVVPAVAPTWLGWTEGGHIEPDRSEIVAELLRIADEELPFRSTKR